MDRCARPSLSCLAAIAMAASAPVCLAQQSAQDPGADAPARAADRGAGSAAQGEEPRSALGKVMSLLITALKENAEPAAHASLEPGLQPRPSAATATVRDIQVGSAFLLDAQPTREPPVPATASID